jgi:hypothetical protein
VIIFERNLSHVTGIRCAFKTFIVIHEGAGRLQLTPMHRWKYCNGYDQRIAKQQLGKHLPLVLQDNSGEFIVVANIRAN